MQTNFSRILNVFAGKTPLQKKVESSNRLMQMRILGQDTVDHLALNLQHAYNIYMRSFDPQERKNAWRAIHMLAVDIAELTDRPCPPPSKELYGQLEAGQ